MDFSPFGRARIYATTLCGVLGCIVVSLIADWSNVHQMDLALRNRAIETDIWVPTLLAAPLLFLLMSKIRQLHIAHRELSHLATTDSLTSLLNRGAFMSVVTSYLVQGGHRRADSGALLVVDVDHFKSVNDRFGHQAGDVVLASVAASIRNAIRPCDIIGRIGGEEFAILLLGADREQAEVTAERIRFQVADTKFTIHGNRERITVSLGGATFVGITSYDRLFNTADRRLYGAKARGRNQTNFVDGEEVQAATAA